MYICRLGASLRLKTSKNEKKKKVIFGVNLTHEIDEVESKKL